MNAIFEYDGYHPLNAGSHRHGYDLMIDVNWHRMWYNDYNNK